VNNPPPINSPKKIAVGSTNPVKVAAVGTVIERAWPGAEVFPVEVDPGVNAMPMSDRECITGARNRAAQALQFPGADLGIGLEGGVNQEPDGLMLLGWVVVVDSDGREGVGGGARLPLPAHIARRVLLGEELGPLMDELLGQTNVKQQGGAVGALTNGLVLRRETFAVAVAYALAPFVTPQFYQPEE
jgi:inosine/xanthosine triphosphatase